MVRKYYRKIYRAWLGKRLTDEEFGYIITSLLGIQEGDSVLVHASFGNLKAGFSPKKANEILMEAVGKKGNLLMPYYPDASKVFLESGKAFDVFSTPTISGILSATFSMFPDVKKSIHPTKSLVVWGKDRDELISEHHESSTPYDEKSPYYKFSRLNNSKVIGLGTNKNSFIHCAEDTIKKYPRYYSDSIYNGVCIDYSGTQRTVKTLIHKHTKRANFSGFFLETKCPEYINHIYRGRRIYVSDCKATIAHLEKLISEGITPEKYYTNLNCLKKFSHDIKYKLKG